MDMPTTLKPNYFIYENRLVKDMPSKRLIQKVFTYTIITMSIPFKIDFEAKTLLMVLIL